MEFPEFLKHRRSVLKISQAQLAKRLSALGQSTLTASVGHWEKGRNMPPIKNPAFRQALANALDMDLNDLMRQLGYIILDEDRSPIARRAADIVDSLPEDIQEIAIDYLRSLDRILVHRPKPVPSMIEMINDADQLLSEREIGRSFPAAAVPLMMAALTMFLQTLWISSKMQNTKSSTFDIPFNVYELIDGLQSAFVVTQDQADKLRSLVNTGNRVVHMRGVEVNREEIEDMLIAVKALVVDHFGIQIQLT